MSTWSEFLISLLQVIIIMILDSIEHKGSLVNYTHPSKTIFLHFAIIGVSFLIIMSFARESTTITDGGFISDRMTSSDS